MKTKEKFPYDLEAGTAVDYVDGRFLLVVKDDFWNEEQIALQKSSASDVHFCYTNGLAVFVVEGGALDSSDFYFNIQECDEKEALLKAGQMAVELVLVDGNNEVCWSRRKDLTLENTRKIQDWLKEQEKVEFMPGEYDINVSGLQSAYEPYDLNKFAKASFKL